MKLKPLILAGSLAAALAVPQVVLAHETSSEGDIAASMHIMPADDPVAGQPTTIAFSFTDAHDRFDAARCDCRLTVTSDGKQLTSRLLTPIESASQNAVLARYTFPYRGSFAINLAGRPKAGADFEPFNLTYHTNVATGRTKPDDSWLWYAGIAVPAVMLVAVGAGKKGRAR